MKKPYSECRHPWDNVQILANGVVKPCCWMTGKGVGNLNDHSLEELWNGDIMQDIRRHITRGQVHSICRGKPCPYNTSDEARPGMDLTKACGLEKDTKMKTCRKVTQPSITKYAGLTRYEAYQLEKACLSLLEKNYECRCGEESQHFPIIIDSIDSECKFMLTYCGECVRDIDKDNHSYKITNLNEQVDCIMRNLEKSGVKHLDMYEKNLCISPSNTLALIDFDLAAVNDHFPTPEILALARNYSNNGRSAFDGSYYATFERRLRRPVMAKNLYVQTGKVVE